MKICFLYKNVFGHGGVQRVITNISNELIKKHDITIINNNWNGLYENVYDLDDNINVINKNFLRYDNNYYRIRRKIIKFLALILNKFKIKGFNKILVKTFFAKKVRTDFLEFINKNNFDCVIGGSLEFNMLLGSISDNVNCKIIGWENNPYNNYYDKGKSYNYLKDIASELLSNLDNLIVLTEKEASIYKSEMNANINIKIIENPLSFSCTEKSKLINKKMLFVGRLDYVKGVDLLIDIFYKIKDKEWHLEIIGEGEYEEFIKNRINELGLKGRVLLSKYKTNIMNDYKEASIYLCTSRYESFGLSILEAMECGIPVVTFNTTGPANLIKDNINGFIIKEYDINKFSNKVNFLIDNIDERIRIGNNNQIKSKKYKIEFIIEKWINLINNKE